MDRLRCCRYGYTVNFTPLRQLLGCEYRRLQTGRKSKRSPAGPGRIVVQVPRYSPPPYPIEVLKDRPHPLNTYEEMVNAFRSKPSPPNRKICYLTRISEHLLSDSGLLAIRLRRACHSIPIDLLFDSRYLLSDSGFAS